MKKLLTVMAVALVALVVSLPAMAGGTPTKSTPRIKDRSVFEAVGMVKRAFPNAAAVKMQVRLGSIGVRGHIGRNLVFRVADGAKILYVDDGVAKLVQIRDLKPGQRADVEGKVYRKWHRAPIFEATRIIVRDPTPAAKLTEYACGGPVTAVNLDSAAPSVTLTVRSASRALWDWIGRPFTETVRPETRVYKWINGVKTTITLAQVKIGDIVWTRGTIDRTNPTAPAFSADVLTVRVSLP